MSLSTNDQFEGAGVAFTDLLKTVAKLRDPQQGCPWDLEQTAKSLLPFLLEESQEFMSTIENNQEEDIQEELGDVLFQIIIHSQIAFEKKLFSMKQMCQKLNEKMIERHPHVFKKNQTLSSATEVKNHWNQSKVAKDGLKKLHDAMKLPPMLAAQKIGSFSHTVGFDWENPQQVVLKVKEELEEVIEVLPVNQQKTESNLLAEEIGDLLFSTIQLARHCQLSADYCLHLANQKFTRRFLNLDKNIKEQKKDLLSMTLEEKELLWKKVKRMETDFNGNGSNDDHK